MTNIYAKLNRYQYFHETNDHQTGHQALFFLTTFEPYGNNFQFLMTTAAILINRLIFLFIYFEGGQLGGGDFQRGQLFSNGLIFWGAISKGEIFREGKFHSGKLS